MSEVLQILEQVNQLERMLTRSSEGARGFPTVKTIYNKPEFLRWKEQALLQLRSLKPEPLVEETIKLLSDGFKTGWNDEQAFRDLKAKVNTIVDNIDTFLPIAENEEYMASVKMRKGSSVKTAFDEYILVKQVGEGGNGRVFSATNSNGDAVAIKFVKRSISADKLKRFKNEIHFCEHHYHKNIVEILDRGYAVLDDTEYVFYVMPLYTETLRGKMKKGLDPAEAVSIFTGLIEGLAYAHSQGTIHRDIKPENIMFKAESVEPIICDFGIAHFAEEELLTIIETKKSDRMANFQYAAPEQRIKGEAATAQTDIYAAALILNEMFTSEIPQAADHKTIASVAPDYAFMDDVFAQLYKQKASDRLYPGEKILTEMKVRAEQYKRNQEKVHLQSVIDEAVAPDNFEATVIKKELRDGGIVFTLSRDIPNEWFQILSSGNLGQYSSLIGYGPEQLEKYGRNGISMRLRGHEDEGSVRSIVENVLDWIPKANARYSAHIKQVAQAEQRKKESARKAEIEKLEKENRLASFIASL